MDLLEDEGEVQETAEAEEGGANEAEVAAMEARQQSKAAAVAEDAAAKKRQLTQRQLYSTFSRAYLPEGQLPGRHVGTVELKNAGGRRMTRGLNDTNAPTGVGLRWSCG